ncbi:hypothetical protein AVEN_243069-1 [Araneus ventricosus]|uniref:Uncharacterized protein n=1 Tax=Araneus ventricosus TaxID=182803 RepID=A0A4Y2W0S9_ARAVE|nr:hypothetical protein AVEN_243069-1 [Araneus ventricosus]
MDSLCSTTIIQENTLCSVDFGHIARGSGRLNGSKDRCEVNPVVLREHAVQRPTRWHHLSEALLVNGRVETSLVQKPQYYEKHEERRYVEAARRGMGYSAKKMVMPGTMDGEGHAKLVMESSTYIA